MLRCHGICYLFNDESWTNSISFLKILITNCQLRALNNLLKHLSNRVRVHNNKYLKKGHDLYLCYTINDASEFEIQGTALILLIRTEKLSNSVTYFH